MPGYPTPGVYVEEVPSAIKPIAGVSTSTAAFIGVVPDKIHQIAKDPNGTLEKPTKWVDFTVPTPAKTARLITNWTQFTVAFGDIVGNPDAAATTESHPTRSEEHHKLAHAVYGFFNNGGSRCYVVRITNADSDLGAALKALAPIDEVALVAAPGLMRTRDAIAADCMKTERFAILDGPEEVDDLVSLTTVTGGGTVKKESVSAATSAALDHSPNYNNGASGVGATLTATAEGVLVIDSYPVEHGERVLVKDQVPASQNGIYTLTALGNAANHYVLTRATDFDKPADIVHGATVPVNRGTANAGKQFAVSSPGPLTLGTTALTFGPAASGEAPKPTNYAAWYFPRITVFDPATKLQTPSGDGSFIVPPSGHIAGVYARVDAERGVHKAPANEAILGALDVTQHISNADQGGLNPHGVNCIRVLNDNILVWGARTVGGEANFDLKYINVRRTLLFLRKSIEQGTQWVVFEPNSPSLWQKITRNITAYLTIVWRSGALFGTTAAEAFYVKCDAETNPPELRDLGRVVTEIGVAIVRPAEFVIFRISQSSGAGA
jgi:phage tail sheath protein FI